jgi:hypothetical protein
MKGKPAEAGCGVGAAPRGRPGRVSVLRRRGVVYYRFDEEQVTLGSIVLENERV